MAARTDPASLRNAARRWPRPPLGREMTWRERERRLLVLGYRAQTIAFRHAHLGDGWVMHFLEKAVRLLDLAAREWIRA